APTISVGAIRYRVFMQGGAGKKDAHPVYPAIIHLHGRGTSPPLHVQPVDRRALLPLLDRTVPSIRDPERFDAGTDLVRRPVIEDVLHGAHSELARMKPMDFRQQNERGERRIIAVALENHDLDS